MWFHFPILFPIIVTLLCETGPANKSLVSTLDTDDLVLWCQGIISNKAEYAPMHFQLLLGKSDSFLLDKHKDIM